MRITASPDPPLAVLAALFVAAAPAWAEIRPGPGAETRVWGHMARAVVRLERADDHPATVVFENRMTIGAPDELAFTLAIEGMSVAVAVTMGDGQTPDVMSVSPPPGFQAEPETIEVDENAVGRIEIRYLPMS
jgi:hypothetical protein